MANRTNGNRHDDMQGTSTALFDVTAMLDASRPTWSAAAAMNGRLYEAMAALNSEYVSFIDRRLKEDMAIPQQIATCRTLEDVYGVYTGFFQRAVEQYQSEMEQLAKLGQTLTGDTVNQAQEQASRLRRDLRM
jgi:Phasin protein